VNSDVRSALRAVAARLRAHDIDFLLGGSGLLWALGLTDEVRDVDLMAAASDEDALLEATSPWRRTHTRSGTELWASVWFSELEVAGVPVDVIGGMAFRHPGGVAALPLRAGGSVEVDGVEVPYADPALWWAVYRAYKPEKAALLEGVVPAEQLDAVAAELGLNRP
jgi:hypothetical protein